MKSANPKIVIALAFVLILVAGLITLSFAVVFPEDEGAAVEHGDELVVLVHGLGRTSMSMLPLAWALEREGYQVLNWGYSSTCCSLAEIGEQLAQDLEELTETEPEQIHFVGHSMGNIVIRWVLHNDPPQQEGRVVMLAPPNNGSVVADRYADWFGWLLEPLTDLTTHESSTVRELPYIADREVAIIAGEYDGKVSVDETRQAQQTAHTLVASHHTFIMNRADVSHLTLSFLAHGGFGNAD